MSTQTRRAQRLAPGGIRLDIQGLRAVAVLSVLAYHAAPNILHGGYVGVDAFFVISGFLITSHLLQSPPETAADLRTFWARRIRRLLPASLLVLAVTITATVLVAPATRWADTARHVIASALYAENWQLASDSASYLKATNPPTPVQHYWSLSVEEQFYLVWPLLLFAVLRLVRRVRGQFERAVTTVVIGVIALSFAYSVWLTTADPSLAYFSTPVRMWELAVGGLLAAFVRLPGRPSSTWAGWPWLSVVGLAGILYSAWTYSESTPFPGWRAAVPVLGTALVIGAGCWEGTSPAGRLLSIRPLPFIGDISYSVYLWHWPLIALLPFVSGRLGVLDKVAVFAVSILLAWLTKRFVEDPFRRAGVTWVGRAPFRFALAGMLVLGGAGLAVGHEVDRRAAAERQAVTDLLERGGPCVGAGAMALGPERCPAVRTNPLPGPEQAAQDRTDLYGQHCFAEPPFATVRSCTFGDPKATVTVALVGNSHAGHWATALQILAEKRHFKLKTYVADGCNVTTTRLTFVPTSNATACLNWGEQVMRLTTSGDVDLVVTSAMQSRPPEAAAGNPALKFPLATKGHRDEIARWVAAGVPVVVIRDVPFTPEGFGTIPECIATHSDDVRTCSGPRGDWLHADPLVEAARSVGGPSVTVVDLSDRLCDATTCYGVIGGITAYYDRSHLTKTYVTTLAPSLDAPIEAALSRVRSS